MSTPLQLIPEVSPHPRDSKGGGPSPRFAEAGELIAKLRANLQQVILGKEEVIELVLIALLARGHLLIEDIPGLGKTTLARALAASINLEFKRIQFTSDLFPGDIIGVNIYRRGEEKFVFQPGPVFSDILLADEINRATPKTQSALLEAMAERQVTLENTTHPLSPLFMVFATQNNQEHYGTNPLPESQLDRFLLKFSMGYPELEMERRILLDREQSDPLARLRPVADRSAIQQIQDLVREVHCEARVLDYLLALVHRTRGHDKLLNGVSPRGSIDFFRAAKARALLHGRDFVIPRDVRELFVHTQAHRVILHPRFEQLSTNGVLMEILQNVEIPA